MLIDDFLDNVCYTEERKRILGYIAEEEAKDLCVQNDYAYCNFNERSRSEFHKFLNYIMNTDADKPVIGTGMIIETDDRERVGRLSGDIMKELEKTGQHTGKIYFFSEKKIIFGLEDSFFEVEGNQGNIIIIHDLLNEKELEDIKKHMFLRKENMWDKMITAINLSKSINIIYSANDEMKGRFGKKDEELKYSKDFYNYHINFGEMPEIEIKKEVIKKLETSGLKSGENFSRQLDQYIKAVYGKSDLKNLEFAHSLYNMIIKEHFGKEKIKILSENSLPAYDRVKTYEEAASELNKMTGLKNIKSFIKELSFMYRADRIKKELSSLHMVFSGNAGTGKTTVAKKIAEIYYSLGIIKKNKVVEVGSSDLIAEYVGQTAVKTKKACQSAYGGILFIDEAYALNPKDASSGMSYRQDCINTLIQEMENNRDKLIVIMAGYPREMEDLLGSNPGLRSRIYKTIEFEDYTDDEMFEIFERMFKENDCILSEAAKEKAVKKIKSLRFEDGFGNGRSVRNMYMQIMQKYMSMESGDEEIVIQPEHIELEREVSDYKELNAKLNAMIGLKNVKTHVKEIMDTNIYTKRKKSDGKEVCQNNNMLLVGNAGTGKSTVAGLISKMLFHIGVTKSPRVENMNISELVSGHVGDATQFLNKKISKAMGGVLFIDELYLLNDMNRGISAEVTGVLLDVFENRCGDITVIIAGYEEETGIFLSSNRGLKSRIPYVIKFDDYNTDELSEMFKGLCKKNNLGVSEDALEKFRRIISDEMKEDGFANGRTVRNIFDAAYRKHAVKIIESGLENSDEIIEADELQPLNEVHKKMIGF